VTAAQLPVRLGAWLRRTVSRAVAPLPYFPDPEATCPAHGSRFCAHCARNPSDCAGADGSCGYWFKTGMHWDTCPNRVRDSR
jgi:hypothetical protein